MENRRFTKLRLKRTARGRARGIAAFGCLGVLCATPVVAQQPSEALPPISVTSTRVGDGIVGASNTVITAEDIRRSPGATLQDLLAQQPGIQTWSTFGGVNGAGTTVDMRGFGATAASNTLVLINGRRITDVDLGGVDFSAIPRDSIERIEITRGNSGAVLYGDNAVGGVINIVTKSGVGLPPRARIEAGFGSFQQREGNASANVSHGPFSMAVFGTAVDSDGYRVNNELRQRNGVADLRYTGDKGTAYFNISADDQNLGLPGARRVTLTSSELEADRRGATTPTAFAEKNGVNVTLGVTRTVVDGMDVILDGGLRQKHQKVFSSLSGFDASDTRVLTTASFTPRFVSRRDLLGMPSQVTAGLDFYDASLDADRGTLLSDPPIHRYSLTQRSTGGYWHQTIGILPTTQVSFGARAQSTTVSARDVYDPTAPGGAFDVQGAPLDKTDTQHALHFGIEHRLNDTFTLFGRAARSFRTPNVDERVGQGFPTNFDLRTQTSRDMEAGVRTQWGRLSTQTSVYMMTLVDEIMFSPATFSNINLDPTRRIGLENSANYQLSDTVRLRGNATYLEAKFRDGINNGNYVPLVSRWSGSVGASWDVWGKWLVLDGVVRYAGSRRMDNDQANFQPLIPAHTVVDIRAGGEIDRFSWSVSVQNLFNADYFDYSVASSTTYGTYNAYPQTGRTFMAKAGVTF